MNVEFLTQFLAAETRNLSWGSDAFFMGKQTHVFLPFLEVLMDKSYSREQLAYEAKLAEEDITEINQRRRAYNRLGKGLRLVLCV